MREVRSPQSPARGKSSPRSALSLSLISLSRPPPSLISGLLTPPSHLFYSLYLSLLLARLHPAPLALAPAPSLSLDSTPPPRLLESPIRRFPPVPISICLRPLLPPTRFPMARRLLLLSSLLLLSAPLHASDGRCISCGKRPLRPVRPPPQPPQPLSLRGGSSPLLSNLKIPLAFTCWYLFSIVYSIVNKEV